ncbi:MAG TPA: YihA family ribosome biogenesis GTP-binding protein [Algoriphagus sp.]|jgi:GTP-binding protein|uniref:Probable GTP-binding protein EngB n=1 Tax=Algoriphagus ornithinivorans TaxID=226506 RepID=A0A1I5EY77_9BACT|nr:MULTISPECIES: ribosome biogenesis GTP-binding protein YihA/YsxC [Algoriphagus]MAL12276.1 YihA family ribosome biogenesis GTP-binding protein [Algoriphagus sp.]MAN88561.1 YihA family ribosome biogenesis GTP-binding protein [Algoriphagus sp.]QYH40128.1 YihA family ribosome biogenesis GTP-binding protein [Algoriphagus sp. NBT04N3]SFO16356.1 GTP-binding protein [Algoriphagus ornithinivorans]HAH39081.1 YihA family ribosome biogenesis GTP-binding protein [Algoriphagus sp.]|tara:strand:+ start:5971 stop:6582 length:612 start_codon:yes stop_codon:yes gene_type:complete
MIQKAEFVVSNNNPSNCPKPDRAEVAFIGRSNVGKSSLINMLTGKKELAKTSQKPGKTQLINHFKIDDRWYLVDLPGYGFAKVNVKVKEGWENMITTYLTKRENLCGVFVLIDSRLEPQKIDLDFLLWCGTNGVPAAIVFTKADKQSKSKTHQNIQKFLKKMNEIFEEIPDYLITSSETGQGKDDLEEFILDLVKEYESREVI